MNRRTTLQDASESPAPSALQTDWRQVAYLLLLSRGLDRLEETRLVPEGKVLYQFSSRGHDLIQVLLGLNLTGLRDGIGAYYRSRPLLLTLGVDPADALAATMGRSGGYSDGRDIGVVSNFPRFDGPVVLPMAGDVGSQFTPAVGWAQAIRYRHSVLGDDQFAGSIAVALGGDGAVATNGFWASLNIATTLRLPLLYFIEDNGYGISVPGSFQTPGGNIARNLASFSNLQVLEADGTCPQESARQISKAVDVVRQGLGPALIRLEVPRLSGHSGQDTQSYKPAGLIERENASDPLKALKGFLVPDHLTGSEWEALEARATKDVENALEQALARPSPDPGSIRRHVFLEESASGHPELQAMGGTAPEGLHIKTPMEKPSEDAARINMLTAIRRTLEVELTVNPRVLIFGEDVGPKGGVHAATMGLQAKFGADRVFDTSLSEEGIIGRAVGMSLAGLVPVPEIQFRKYSDPAAEQLNNCGTIRWRTANRFAAPVVVRMPGGFAKCGDPWHSVSGEVLWAHAVGWRVAMPSNAEDAVGLLRSALRGNDPTIFFEHRALLDAASARRPYPGDHFMLPFGRARVVREGERLTVVTWAAMVERCDQAAARFGNDVEVLDLRTISPWDRESVIGSVRKTRRCLIVHEDGLTAGFGAEIAATVGNEAFFDLDAPVDRLAVPDIPIPYNVQLMEAVVPTVEEIAAKLESLLSF